ncbi:DUF6443 domain-containing protein [Flavobacterium sp.]|uniref:DUF6443 domain-containing protein n=1 Tax=Flavobacterium sp. TaxID=239 RepID=UPI00122B4B3E|nr:DUF6443 domain-containing protein [Flavobacterium sp.]RZJ72540.1 MAG: RHS repeat-associated core domain-containing protein [Flavobacterium sp.]
MKRKFLLLIALPLVGLGQSANQNYAKTTVYRTATTTSIANPTPEQAKVSVSYFDGLGKPIQTVQHKQSNSGKDVISSVRYDAFNRPNKDFLPYPASDATMLFRDSLTVNSGMNNYPIYSGDVPFSQIRFEESPLGRVLKRAAPGYNWQIGSGHEIKSEYQTNLNNEVKLISATSTWSSTLGIFKPQINDGGTSYPAGRLFKMVTKDESWEAADGVNHTQEEFKDVQGRIILKRRYNAGISHDTYYVYDQFGNLTYVIPPSVSGTVTEGKLNGQCYQYRYDRRDRIAHKKLPGKNWEFFVYDKLDRLVATGPALTPFTDLGRNTGWIITKYDAMNRIVLTGWLQQSVDSLTWKSRQYDRDQETINFSETKIATTTNSTVGGVSFRYSNLVWPTTAYHVLTVNYYDDYNFPNAPSPIPSQVASNTQSVFYNDTNKPKGLSTGNYIRVLETTADTRREVNYILYDIYGRGVRNHKINHLGGYTINDSKLDFSGQIIADETIHKYTSSSASNTDVTVKQFYTYSPQGYLTKTEHRLNANPSESLAKFEYDELGKMTAKRVGGSDLTGTACLQKIDYYSNIRGWLTDINYIMDPSTGLPIYQSTNPDDLFRFKIHYDDPSLGNVFGAPPPGEALYNGNISETEWKTRSDMTRRRYRYFYDDLDRLIEASYEKPDNSTPETNSYDEVLSYDKNGNITHLNRNGEYDDNLYNLQIDNLTYTYDTSKIDRLLSVSDSSGISAGFNDGNIIGSDYGYDTFGNLIADKNKGIKVIVYNHLNLPTGIDKGSSSRFIKYTYNAVGTKVAKSWSDGTATGTTDYQDMFQYTDGVMDFIATSEGNVDTKLKSGGLVFNYVYNYLDHLGNIRLRYAADQQTGEVKILEENNYYPFGLKHNNYNISRSAYIDGGGVGPCTDCPKFYNYKYNGKEWQDELAVGWYNYGARNYDPAIGRWMNIDILADNYAFASPYNYVLNSPTSAIDPDGKRVYFIAGAGNDSSGWRYTERWAQTFYNAGMQGKFYVVNSSRGQTADMDFTFGNSSEGYKREVYVYNYGGSPTGMSTSSISLGNPIEGEFTENSYIDSQVGAYEKHLKDNPLAEGEQMNMVGYSFGSVMSAQVALRLASKGQVIDNLILIGSPISDSSNLYKQLKAHKNIKNIIRYDIPGDKLSNPKDILDWIQGASENTDDKTGHHFDLARPGTAADRAMQVVITWLMNNGVK